MWKLSEPELREFGIQGYVVVRDVISPAILTAASRAIERLVDEQPPPEGYVGPHFCISAAIMRVRRRVELCTFACGGGAISADGASACAMNCWSLTPSARLWIKRPHDAGGAIAMAYNSALQRTGGTARNLRVMRTIECRWGSAARR
jgi:hypothetical protein